jgi:anaerobic selenocysteine-containing dehydrogenase
MPDPTRTAIRTCPLCEATCGLELELRGEELVKVRADKEDVFSEGFICPKGVALKELHDDPDRIRTPLIRQPDGSFAPATFDEAFALIDERLGAILARGDRNAVGVYIGNPNAHNLANLLYIPVFLKALGSKNNFSASSVDQVPKQMANALMFGTSLSVPIPDIDRTDYLLILGANPMASNGSLMTAPNMRGRLRAIKQRGGKIVVVDPRRSRTAEEADEHVPIRPGTDALLLFGIVHVLFAEGLVNPGPVGEWLTGIEEIEELAAPFTPEAVAPGCGVPAETVTRLAREIAAAPSAAVYGRIGTTTQEFGTLTSWLVDVVTTLTGNLDRPGGAMFPKAAAGAKNTAGPPGKGRGARFGRWASRVREIGEVFGELPSACLAEEIDTPGEGQVRALVTISGNPARSLPNSTRLERAFAGLEFMVSMDVYLNETTRHADVILPAPSPLRRPHYDLAFTQFSVRNYANFSPPVLPPQPELPDEHVTLMRLAGIAAGQGPGVDVEAFDDMVAAGVARREGLDVEAALAAVAPRRGPERLLDLMLRGGAYDLTLADLEAAPHGIDLGPLEPRIPELLRTASGMVELAPGLVTDDVPRLRAAMARRADPEALVLVGRRHLRSNNSWMHNLPMLMSGPERCTLHVHPDDAARLGLTDGGRAEVSSRSGAVDALVEVTDAVMPGVVSLPHGWGHDDPRSEMDVAGANAGTNSNVLADELLVDAVSGNAVLNGIPVAVAPVAASAREPALA